MRLILIAYCSTSVMWTTRALHSVLVKTSINCQCCTDYNGSALLNHTRAVRILSQSSHQQQSSRKRIEHEEEAWPLKTIGFFSAYRITSTRDYQWIVTRSFPAGTNIQK